MSDFFGGLMELSLSFFITCLSLGVGLAMDAFSVSLANGLGQPKMCRCRMLLIAGVFALFQGLMPMLGWVCVHTVIQIFSWLDSFIPWIALVLLLFVGGKMLLDGLKGDCEDGSCGELSLGVLIMQGVATSIDALSVGFTIAEYGMANALLCAAIIAAVTFCICFCGVAIGKTFGTRLAGKAQVFGGIVLILIGVYICLSGVLGW